MLLHLAFFSGTSESIGILEGKAACVKNIGKKDLVEVAKEITIQNTRGALILRNSDRSCIFG
jgi:hypothetical protein